jgi:hypothetical protein
VPSTRSWSTPFSLAVTGAISQETKRYRKGSIGQQTRQRLPASADSIPSRSNVNVHSYPDPGE